MSVHIRHARLQHMYIWDSLDAKLSFCHINRQLCLPCYTFFILWFINQ